MKPHPATARLRVTFILALAVLSTESKAQTIFKLRWLVQTSDTTLIPDPTRAPWGFGFDPPEVEPPWSGGELTLPSNVTIPLSAYFGWAFLDKAALDVQFPNGIYRFSTPGSPDWAIDL